MKYTKEEIVKRVTSELDECLETANAEIYRYEDKIVEVDLEKQTITIKFDYNIVEEDDYVGLAFY
jgi:copper chaperone CopZ